MSRTALVIVLVVALTAPSLGAQQSSPDETQAWRALVAALEPAALIDVRMKDGKRIHGTVLQQTAEGLVLKPRTRVPVPARTIAFSDIESVERKKIGMAPGTKVLLGVGIGFGVILLSALAVFSSYD